MSTNPPTLASVTELSDMYNAQQTAASIPQHKNKSWYEDFKLFFSMMNDKEFKLEKSTMLSVGGALAYVVLPIDAVPDFLPFVGWLDDAVVLKLVMDSAKGEVNRFKIYKAQVA